MVSVSGAELRIVLINVPNRSSFRQARSIRRTASPFWGPLPEHPAIDEAYALEVSVLLRTSRMPPIPLSDTRRVLAIRMLESVHQYYRTVLCYNRYSNGILCAMLEAGYDMRYTVLSETTHTNIRDGERARAYRNSINSTRYRMVLRSAPCQYVQDPNIHRLERTRLA